jgi:alpha-tubulin suppressor-like RCC1 family protein
MPSYSGVWTLQAQMQAEAAGNWPKPPVGLFAWGSNNAGQLGINNTTYYSSPKQVGAASTWSTIDAGYAFVVSTKKDGTLWAWGNNSQGQLGIGNLTNRSSPVQVGALTSWYKVSGGYAHTLAIKTDGTLWSWGFNNFGQLGLGNTSYISSPNQVGALTTWSEIAAVDRHSLAVKTDGTLWSWGRNANYGQLGLGNRTNYSSPKQVGALTAWLTLVVGGASSSFAIKTDGTFWAWGRNSFGNLGLGNSTNYSSPKQVGALTTWLSVAGGLQHTLATKSDGTIWAWGSSTYGQLGQGNTTSYNSPKQVGLLTTWLSATAGTYDSSIAIKTDGTLWGWGNNPQGVLGRGNQTDYSSPVQLGALTSWVKAHTGHTFTVAIKG